MRTHTASTSTTSTTAERNRGPIAVSACKRSTHRRAHTRIHTHIFRNTHAKRRSERGRPSAGPLAPPTSTSIRVITTHFNFSGGGGSHLTGGAQRSRAFHHELEHHPGNSDNNRLFSISHPRTLRRRTHPRPQCTFLHTPTAAGYPRHAHHARTRVAPTWPSCSRRASWRACACRWASCWAWGCCSASAWAWARAAARTWCPRSGRSSR